MSQQRRLTMNFGSLVSQMDKRVTNVSDIKKILRL